jgi:hypothetical protein
MKKLSLIFLSFFLFLSFTIQAQSLQWAKTYGGTGNERVVDIKVDTLGNVYILGTYQGQVVHESKTFFSNDGSQDLLLLKYNSAGVYQWGYGIGGIDTDDAAGLAIDNQGNVIITGYVQGGTIEVETDTGKYLLTANFDPDIFIAKYSTNGQLMWAKLIESQDQHEGKAVVTDNSNNIYVTGYVQGEAYIDTDTIFGEPGYKNALLAKLSPSGTLIWGKAIGANNNVEGTSVTIMADGEIALAGMFSGTNIDFNPSGTAIVLSSMGANDAFFIRIFAATGQCDWAKSISGTNDINVNRIACSANNKLALAGSFQGTANFNTSGGTTNRVSNGQLDMYVAVYNAAGTLNWAHAFGSTNNDIAYGVVFDSYNDVYFTGSFNGTVDFNPAAGTNNLAAQGISDVVFGKYDEFGAYKFAYAIGSASQTIEEGRGIAIDKDDYFYVTGFVNGLLRLNPFFGNYVYNSFGGSNDLFFAKYSNCLPGDALKINGSNLMCPGEEYILDVDPIRFATSYQWNFSPGTTIDILSGDGTNTIKVAPQAGGIAGTLTVQGVTECGLGNASNLFTLDAKAGVDFTITITNAPSCGQKNGALEANVTTGAAPYFYQWSTGDTISTVDSIPSGTYQLNMRDADGCKASKNISLNDAGAPSITEVVTDNLCHGEKNGAIDLSISGGQAPYNIQWSNGAQTEDISNLKAGGYGVKVKDAAGCLASKCIFVNEPAPLIVSHVSNNTSACSQSDGSIVLTVVGGTAPYTYAWSNSETSSTINNLAVGAYFVTVTDQHSCVKTDHIAMSDPSGPVALLSGFKNASCNNNSGHIFLSVEQGTSILWTTSDTNFYIDNLAPGMYGVVVSNQFCSKAFTYKVVEQAPPVVPFCLVTVDTSFGKYVLVYDREVQADIEQFNFYLEGCVPGYFHQIGFNHKDTLSEFVDMFSDPQVRSWTYTMTTQDACGNESSYAPIHKTIHLSMNRDTSSAITLIWSNYVGYEYDMFYISRFTKDSGWVEIDSVSYGTNKYIDTNPPKANDDLYYEIAVNHPFGCASERAEPKNYNSSRSNYSANVGTGGPITPIDTTGVNETNALASSFNLYPNPNSGNFNLNFHFTNNEIKYLQIFDIQGREVYMENLGKLEGTLTREINLKAKPGIYNVRVYSESEIQINKLIIQ